MREPGAESDTRARSLLHGVRLFGLRRPGGGDDRPGLSGVARLDKRTKNLAKRMQPGEIAVIDHVDLDRVAADSLVSAGVAAVVNVAPSISGRYPNLGPEILLEAGVALLDDVDPEIFEKVREGEVLRLDGASLYRGDELVAKGIRHTPETIEAAIERAKAGLSEQLESFVSNTLEYVRKEQELLTDGIGVPDVRTSFEGRHALIVVRGYHYREDIATLRPYIREYKPVLIGVDGGADALLKAGYKPDMIVGDMDSVSDEALTCGAEIVVHAYRDGRAPGLKRVEALGQDAVVFPAAATSEDCAMLLADDKGAELIVAVGTHMNMVEFFDKGRAGMSSTFLTRLRVGSKLVDAKGVSLLYRSRISSSALLLLVAAAMVAMVAALAVSPSGPILMSALVEHWHSFLFWLTGFFT